MSEYKRLTQWTENGASLILDNPQNENEARKQLMQKFKLACNKLAELEDKIEQGTLIELPCKVGDTVYLPWEYGGVCSIAYLTVTHIILDTKKSYIRTDFETDIEDYWEKYKGGQYDFSDFGKIIFTNKAEAEKRLKELQE